MISLFLTLIEEEGDRQKFHMLYDTYRYRMLYIAKQILKEQHLAEDAVQDSFLYFAVNINKLDDVLSPKVRNYVYIVVKHKSIDIWRKSKRETTLNDFELEKLCGGYNHVEQLVLENLEYEKIFKAILKLPVIYRDCLELNIVYSLPAKKIASLLKEKHETIKKRIQRGKEILREMINE